MAEKILKSINFPGLEDTYIIPEVDNTLKKSGSPADAKAVGDALATKQPVGNYVKTINGNAPDENGNVTIEVGSGGSSNPGSGSTGSVEQVQSDWNQTDDTAVDFIKNKPFYGTSRFVELLPHTEYSGFALNSMYGVYMCDATRPYDLVVGETYRVTWDGTAYECVAQDAGAVLSGAIAVGNASAFGLSGNSEPFIVVGFTNAGATYVALTDTANGGIHTVSIEKLENNFYFDSKYLSISQSDWNVTDESNPTYIKNKPFGVIGYDRDELLPHTLIKCDYNGEATPYICHSEVTPEQLELWDSDWVAAEVVWDGATYFCKQQKYMGLKVIGNLDAMMGTGDNGMPFATAVVPASMTGTADMTMTYSAYDIPNMLLSDSSSRNFVEVEGQSYTKCELTDVLDIIEGPLYSVVHNEGTDVTDATTYITDDGTYIGIGNPAMLGIGEAQPAYRFFIYTKTASDGAQTSAILLDSTRINNITRVYSPPFTSHAMSITLLHEQINPIDSKFISEVSWNSVTDKPFYREPNRVVLDTTFQDTKEDRDGDGVPETWEGIGLFEDSSDIPLIEGDTYTVTWNGVKYTDKCEFYEGLLPAVGNLDAVMGTGDNGMPFVLLRDINGLFLGVSGWLAFILSNRTDDGVYTCKVETSTLKYLDNKYLEFMDTEEEVVLIPKQNLEFQELGTERVMFHSETPATDFGVENFNFEVGKTYRVQWKGTEYDCVAKDGPILGNETNTQWIGNVNIIDVDQEDTGEPFFMLDGYDANGEYNGLQIYSHRKYEASVSMQVGVYRPGSAVIKKEYLPEGLGNSSSTGSGLPEVTTSDVGKFLRVSADGLWAAETIPNAEGVGF